MLTCRETPPAKPVPGNTRDPKNPENKKQLRPCPPTENGVFGPPARKRKKQMAKYWFWPPPEKKEKLSRKMGRIQSEKFPQNSVLGSFSYFSDVFFLFSGGRQNQYLSKFFFLFRAGGPKTPFQQAGKVAKLQLRPVAPKSTHLISQRG